jgi:hypothetical protein
VVTALALAVYVCPRCAKRYTAPPGSTITCTHAGTPQAAFKREVARLQGRSTDIDQLAKEQTT